MAWPATDIANRTAGEFVDDVDWDELVDALNFLAARPACRLTNSGTLTVNNNSETLVTFDTETYDTNGLHSTSSNTARITIATAGIWLFTWALFYNTDTDYTLTYSYLQKNGSGIHTVGSEVGTQGDANTGPMLIGTAVDKFAVSDFLQILTNQKNTSGGSHTVSNQVFTATWLGRG